MKRHLLILCFLCFGNTFSQSLEKRIYKATETFNASKSPEALILLNEDIATFTDAVSTSDDYFAFINLLVNKAHYLQSVNKNTLAIQSYEKAWQLYTRKKIDTVYKFNIVDYCLIPLGILYHKIGDYTSAENTIKTYIALAEKNKNHTQRIAGTVNLARLYQTIGRHALAIDIANYGLSIKQGSAQQTNKLKRIKSRSLLQLNKTNTFIDSGGIVLNLQNESHEDHELAYQLAMEQKDFNAALKHFKKLKPLKAYALSSASEWSKIYIEEAQLYYLLNDKVTSKKNIKIALKTLLPNYDSNVFPNEDDLYPENAFIGIFDLLATLETDPEKAIAYYNLSFYVSDLLSKNITSQNGKLLVLNENRIRSENTLDLLYFLQNTTNDSKYTFEALQLSERYKASILKEMVSKKKLLERYPKDALLIRQQQLLQTQEHLTNTLIKTPVSNFNAADKLKIREELTAININLKALAAEISKKYNLSDNTTLDLAKLQSKLTSDQATLVNYFYGKHALYQIIVSNKATAFNKINLNKTNAQRIKQFIRYFNTPSALNNNISNYTKDAHKLYNVLKLNEVKDKENLIIITDGFLNFVPFDALLTAKTDSKLFQKMPFFIYTHSAVFNSSVSLYINDRTAQKEQSVLGVFPVFRETDLELAYSVNEAESIQKEIETTLLMDCFATKEAFLKSAKKHSILHVSTHGTGGDFFEPAQIRFSDQSLSTHELYSLNLNPDLVVLSACETGVGELKKGEGTLSIARGFQYAGAKKVLYSLWQISDLSTSQIMASFYKQFDKTKSFSFSNRQSKLDYLTNKKNSNLKKSPYYWSAFTLYGSFDKVEETNYIYLTLGVSLVIILLLLWLYKRQNGKRTLGLSGRKRV